MSETSDKIENVKETMETKKVLKLIKPLDEITEKPLEENFGRVNKNLPQNATDSHPLMFPPLSPIASNYPDLIPKQSAQVLHDCATHNFKPVAHSSVVANQSSDLNLDPEKIDDFLEEQLNAIPLSPNDFHTNLSDNENDKSIYEAQLSSNLQNVALKMNDKQGNLNFLTHEKQSNKLRKIKVVPTEVNSDSDEVSSLDSSLDSLKSEDVFSGLPDKDIDSPEPIEPLSADDERRHARHWQRMILPGGEQRTIDMRVIEPYKRVLSHGGYLRAGGHTAIVIFSACYLPDKSRCDYDYVMENLFMYVLWTLERLVTEDYVLVYLHGGATRLPSFSWIKRCYQMVGRKLRKNLGHLYLVHPTLWIKTMLFMAKPFISSKFYHKISFISSLRDLKLRVPIELAAVPEKVKAYDSLHCC